MARFTNSALDLPRPVGYALVRSLFFQWSHIGLRCSRQRRYDIRHQQWLKDFSTSRCTLLLFFLVLSVLSFLFVCFSALLVCLYVPSPRSCPSIPSALSLRSLRLCPSAPLGSIPPSALFLPSLGLPAMLFFFQFLRSCYTIASLHGIWFIT
jgi:hypothetical protein